MSDIAPRILAPRIAMYNPLMVKRVIHISEEDAASDFASLMASVRAGAEVIIEENTRP